MKRITEGELWELVDIGRGDVKNNRFMNDVINGDKTEYSSHKLTEIVDGKHNNDWILIERYRTGK